MHFDLHSEESNKRIPWIIKDIIIIIVIKMRERFFHSGNSAADPGEKTTTPCIIRERRAIFVIPPLSKGTLAQAGLRSRKPAEEQSKVALTDMKVYTVKARNIVEKAGGLGGCCQASTVSPT